MIEVASTACSFGSARLTRGRADQLGITHGGAERIDQVVPDRRGKMSEINEPISVIGSSPARWGHGIGHGIDFV